MRIKISYSEECGYSVEVDGDTILECLGEDDLQELTIGEIASITFMNELGKALAGAENSSKKFQEKY